jgi:hypothetical protein
MNENSVYYPTPPMRSILLAPKAAGWKLSPKLAACFLFAARGDG